MMTFGNIARLVGAVTFYCASECIVVGLVILFASTAVDLFRTDVDEMGNDRDYVENNRQEAHPPIGCWVVAKRLLRRSNSQSL